MAILLLHCRFSEDIMEQGPEIINCSEFPNEPHELDEASKYRHVTFYFPSNDYKEIKIIMCINTLQKYVKKAIVSSSSLPFITNFNLFVNAKTSTDLHI